MPTAGGKRKKVTTVTEDLPDSETQEGTTEFDLELQRADDVETVDTILREHGISNVTYRFYDEQGRYAFSSDKIEYDRARQETRGGACKLGVFINDKIIRMVPFPLAPVVQDSVKSSPESGIIAALTAHSQFLEKAFLAFLTKEREPGPPPPTPPSLVELTGALKNLDDMRGKQESTVELFMKGVDFAMSQNGQTDWKTDALKTVREVAPGILQTISGFGGNGHGRRPIEQPQPQPGQPGEEMQMPPPEMVKMGLDYLKAKALKGMDPDFIVEWVTGNAEEYQGLLRVVLNQELSDIAKRYDPEINNEPYRGWFESLFNGLRSAFKQSDTVDTDTGRDAGNDSDPGNDGKPSKDSKPEPAV